MNQADGGQPGVVRPNLVVKNIDRIESINVPGEDRRREAVLYTYVLSRVMRRDFNLTSVMIFFACKKRELRALVREDLRKLTDEAFALSDLAHRYEMPDSPVQTRHVMRILSDETDEFFDALLTADRALCKIMHSPLGEMAEETLSPFMQAFHSLRRRVIRFPERPTNINQAESEPA